jgi:hypothetical protein
VVKLKGYCDMAGARDDFYVWTEQNMDRDSGMSMSMFEALRCQGRDGLARQSCHTGWLAGLGAGSFVGL